MVYRKIPYYIFDDLEFISPCNTDFLKKSFFIALPELKKSYECEKVLFSIPNSFELRVIKRSYSDDTNDIESIRREGCFYFNEENEWILEASLFMRVDDCSETAEYRLRLPLSAPFIEKNEIGIYFDGCWIRFMQNGEVLNENSGMDCFAESSGEIFIDESFKDIRVSEVNSVEVKYIERESSISPDFFFPYGWNSYIGDVMSFYHNGVYHLMYLIDRRHHGSRNGCGAHYICHLTSKNMVDWYEQEPITEIDKPWITYGTGTMLFHNGKYYMTYGFHTERYNGSKLKITPPFDDETKQFENITFKEIEEREGLPTGASYSVSEDGIIFKPSNILFHSARNPSAYINENGGITLYCGYGGEGVYESESFDIPFRHSSENFDFVKNSVMKNTSECPAFFDWNGYKYLIVGFTGYFRTIEKDSNYFVDASALGENIYDGLSVPMVAKFGDNRRIMAGWVESPWGWGGVMMQRELIAEENGKLGMKWIPELAPETGSRNLIYSEKEILNGISIDKFKSYYLELNIAPKNAERIGISFSDGASACVFELDFKQNRVQINGAQENCFGEKIPTMLEQMSTVDVNIKNLNEIPRKAKNYSLADIRGINEPFVLKIMLRYSRKLRSTVVDAEIAQRRTFISVRNGFFPTKITAICDGDSEILSVSLKDLKCVEN